MNTDVHHNTTCVPVTEAGTMVTLGEIRDAIELSDTIPTRRKKYLCWALTRTIALIGNEHMERFGDYLKHEAILDKADEVIRVARYAWNRAVDTVPGWPVRRVARPRPGVRHTGCAWTSSPLRCSRSSRRTSSSWVTPILSWARTPEFFGRGPSCSTATC